MASSKKAACEGVPSEKDKREPKYLAVDVSGDLTVGDWRRQMDLTRALHGHDDSAKTGKSRTFYRFTLSPASGSAYSLETLRAFAREWAEENFRNGGRRHEYAILHGFENDRLQACVVVNATDKGTGRKLRLWGMDNMKLAMSAREIGGGFGFDWIDLRSSYSHESLREGGL